MSFSVCKFYKYNRNCKFGNNCRYLHSDLSQRPPPSASTEESSHGTVNTSSEHQHTQSPTQINFVTKSEEISHEELVNSSTHSPAASHLDKSDTRPDHEGTALNYPSSFPIAGTDSSNANKPQSSSRNNCRYFKQHGHCNFGKNCRFGHGNGADAPSARQPRYPQQSARRHIPPPPRYQRKEAEPSAQLVLEPLPATTEANDVTETDLQATEQGYPAQEPSSHSEKSHVDDTNRDNGSKRNGNGKLCKYFKAGYCNRGRRCMFLHQRGYKVNKNDGEKIREEQADTDKDDTGSSETTQPSVVKHQTRPDRPVNTRPLLSQPQVVTFADLQTNGTEKYRQFDVNYLAKRFQAVHHGATDAAESSTPKELMMEVSFSPSDPDWPFDIKTFILDLTLPNDYPKQAMLLVVPMDKQELPETVRRYLEVTMNDWIKDRQEELAKNSKAELMVRPFFRWLDRNFEDVMTGALTQLKRELTARAAGFEFIPATHLKAKYVADNNDGDESASQEEDSGSLDDDDDESSDECLDSDDDSDDESENDDDTGERHPGLSLDTDRKGTEIQLRHMQLKQNASSLMFERLHLIIQCGRCKHHSEVSIGGERAVAQTCEKCNHEMYVQYRPTLAHQFSSVVGYLDLDSCVAFDLIFPDCKIVVSCFSCGKVTKINGMMSGQMSDGWCQACNARFKFASEAVKFYQLQPSDFDEEKKKHAEVSGPKKTKKPPKDPAIREGQPLPDFGACRHYKQSYRWLRFPCCGKAYPCDVCHDKKEDHEMTLANRMICGHCCKEQNYSASRPCVSCSQHLTKVRSSHWEGGAGCRNRIAMSRNDQHKYKNMNKTISRKKGESNSAGKKKNTKLRHA